MPPERGKPPYMRGMRKIYLRASARAKNTSGAELDLTLARALKPLSKIGYRGVQCT